MAGLVVAFGSFAWPRNVWPKFMQMPKKIKASAEMPSTFFRSQARDIKIHRYRYR